MPQPILMPQVGQDLTTGKLVEWKVGQGDKVKKGDIVAVVESEKASFEVEAFEEGIVLELLYAEGDDATVLEPILLVGAPGETAGAKPASANGAAAGQATASAAASAPIERDTPVNGRPGRLRASPLARRLAGQLKVDLAAIAGSGPRGIIVKRDVEAAAASALPVAQSMDAKAPAPTPAPEPALARAPEPAREIAPSPLGDDDREIVFDRMRLAVAQRLSLSKRTIPHFYLRATADVSDLQTRRRAAAEIAGTKISLNDVLIKVAALSLLEFPHMNAHVSDDRMVVRRAINVGVAVALEHGLMVPVVADADKKSVEEIAAQVRDYAAAARRGVMKSTAVGTFSISNLGMYGVDVQPIINPPEAAILGVGPVARELREHKGGLFGRDILSLSVSADHRAVDGAYAARFLSALVETLQDFRFDA